MAEVVLTVGGQKYAGWKTARVTRGIESIAGSFALSVSERWANQAKAWPINEEDECSLSVDGTTVITGYVDDKNLSYDAGSHTFEVSGRDKTGDLVDCSALLDKWEFKNISVKQFAEKLCNPFGIGVSLQTGLILGKSPAKISIGPGDTAFNALEHTCRLASLLPISDGQGGLILTRAGSAKATDQLVEGQNILSASASFKAADRFARYVVLGQHAASDDFFGEQVASVKAEASDPNVRRSARVLVVRPEGNVTAEHAKMRAQWEATARAARAGTVTVTVQGWKQSRGGVWPVNALVRVSSPLLGVDGEMLITQAVYEVSESNGTTTTLSLKRPDSFKPEPSVSRDGLWKEIARGV